MSMPAGFVERLVLLTERAGSKAALARSAGVRPTTLQAWFTGADPATSHLAAVAFAAGVSLDWLVNGVGDGAAPDPAEQALRLECLWIAALSGERLDTLPEAAEWLALYAHTGRFETWDSHPFNPATEKTP